MKNNILNYLKKQKWFFGIRPDFSLFLHSIKRLGCREHLKKYYGKEFTESLLIPIDDDFPIRIFNLNQAKKFHRFSEEKIFRNPKILSSYIERDNILWEKILRLTQNLNKLIINQKYEKGFKLFLKILELYKLGNSNFIIIFSLGLKLEENKDKIKNIKNILKKHDFWRNSIFFKEEKMENSLLKFLNLLFKSRNLKIDIQLIKKYLIFNEIIKWINKRISDKDILRIINLRKKQGFVFLNLRKTRKEIIDDKIVINKIRKYFSGLNNKDDVKKDEISGEVSFKSDKKIKGKVVLIKDKSKLIDKNKLLKNNILVSIQTTPHYIPYLKNVKAIITDEGGITCHAAIVSREMKKPCIIGTKIATKILKDDDLVEVDANKGIVKILKRAKEKKK
jgi:phosphohistidine swiveling domain-containing protein